MGAKQVRKKFANGITGVEEYIHVLLDTTYMKPDDYAAFMEQLMKEASPDELGRIIHVNAHL